MINEQSVDISYTWNHDDQPETITNKDQVQNFLKENFPQRLANYFMVHLKEIIELSRSDDMSYFASMENILGLKIFKDMKEAIEKVTGYVQMELDNLLLSMLTRLNYLFTTSGN